MSEVDANQVAADFARRLRANADYAEASKFSVANLSTLPVADCRALADWMDAALAAVTIRAPAPVDPFDIGLSRYIDEKIRSILSEAEGRGP